MAVDNIIYDGYMDADAIEKAVRNHPEDFKYVLDYHGVGHPVDGRTELMDVVNRNTPTSTESKFFVRIFSDTKGVGI
jgi:hypothetical protein